MAKTRIHFEHICNRFPSVASITQSLDEREGSDNTNGDIALILSFPTETYMYENDGRSVLRHCRDCQELQSRYDRHVLGCESFARCLGIKRINDSIEG